MISHRNVISNVMQLAAMERPQRAKRPGNGAEVGLGLLPLSHIYGLVVIAQGSTYRGDGVIILPKFELPSYLNSISTYKIETLYLVGLHPCPLSSTPRTKTISGPPYHYSNGQKPTRMRQI
jgi:acyl-CoA synthetase (AMP-forming)/AMP-acid ligase II